MPTETPTLLPTLQPTLNGDATAVELKEELMDKVLDGGTKEDASSMAAQLDGWTVDAADTPSLLPTMQPTTNHDTDEDDLADELVGISKTKQLVEWTDDLAGEDDDFKEQPPSYTAHKPKATVEAEPRKPQAQLPLCDDDDAKCAGGG